MRVVSIVPGIVAGVVLASPAHATSNTLTCSLQAAGEAYNGTCMIPCLVNALAINIDGVNAGTTCSTPPRSVNASLRKTDKGNWLGTMEGKFPEDPTRFEITVRPDAAAVGKLPYGWFGVTEIKSDTATMSLTINADKQLPPTQDDLKIIQRAKALVSDIKVWNKQDDRKCPPNPVKWSVFCALMQATEETSGGVHYRQPALQAVREVVNQVGGTRVDKHRLMDYNNHPDTTLAEIHAMLDMATARLTKDFR